MEHGLDFNEEQLNKIIDQTPRYEKVNHPEHYNKGIEAIDYIESHKLNFSLGNAIKYITRCEYKEDKLNDLRKAKWYIEREIERESANNE